MFNIYIKDNIETKAGDTHIDEGWYTFVRYFGSTDRILIRRNTWVTVVDVKHVDPTRYY